MRELRGAGHRALMFSQFVRHLDLIKGVLEAEGVTYHYIDGATSAQERAARVEAFQSGERDVFLMSLRLIGCIGSVRSGR